MNNESVVFNGLSALLRTNVCEPIVTYLQSRQQQSPVTVDELCNVLKLPASSTAIGGVSVQSAPAQSSAQPGFPSMNSLVGFGGMPMQMGGAKKPRGKSTTEAPPDHERCQYRYTRGANKGNQCTNRHEQGIPFCKQCKGKKTAQTQLEQGGVSQYGDNSSQSMPGALPGMPPGLPGMPTALSGGLGGMQQPVSNQKDRIQATPIAPGFYRESKYGLALKTGQQPNEYICCGVIKNPMEPNNISPLTEEHIAYCKQANLSYVDTEQPPSSMNNQGLPTMGNQGSMSQGLPSMNNPGGSMSQGLPSMNNQGSTPQGLPTMGSMSQGLSTMSNQGSMSQGLPSMNNQGSTPQGLPTMGSMSQGLPTMGSTPQGLPNVNNSGSAPQGLPTMGSTPQGLPSMNNQGSTPQGLPTMGSTPQGLPSMNNSGSSMSQGQFNMPQTLPQVPSVGESSNYPSLTDTSSPDDPYDSDDE